MIHPKFMVGAELVGWTRSEEDSDGFDSVEITSTWSNWAVAGTFFPTDPASSLGGLYLRAGIGAAEVESELKVSGITFSGIEDGLGLLLGGGYEFRLTDRFVLGVGASFNELSLGGEDFDSVRFRGFAFDLNWHL